MSELVGDEGLGDEGRLIAGRESRAAQKLPGDWLCASFDRSPSTAGLGSSSVRCLFRGLIPSESRRSDPDGDSFSF